MKSRTASMKIKSKVHNEYVLPVMVYGSATWALNKAHMRRAVLALGQRDGPPYQPGSILMDTPLPLTELLQRAADRRGWARDGRSLSSPQESP